MTTLFVAANVGIFLGYVFIAFFVAPHFQVKLRKTKWGGFFFFLTCGLTHAEHALHAGWFPGEPFADLVLAPHMIAIHIVQVVSVWAFVSGLYQEFVLFPRREARALLDSPKAS